MKEIRKEPNSQTEQKHRFVLKVPVLKVYVREAFYWLGQGECWLPGNGIADLGFEIDGRAVTGKNATTNKPHKVTEGLILSVPLHPKSVPNKEDWDKRVAARQRATEASEATLPLDGVADGEHTLKVVPAAAIATPAPAGPSLQLSQSRGYRPLYVKFTMLAGEIIDAKECDPIDPKVTINHGHVTAFNGMELCIDIKPDLCKKKTTRKRVALISLIIIHHTGSHTIGTALNEALERNAPHYEIDPLGHVVKIVDESHVAGHAGTSWWAGKNDCNEWSIGIEMVHWEPDYKKEPTAKPSPYPDVQYEALLRLLQDLVKMYSIPRHRIVGHSDVRTEKHGDPRLLSSDRQTCPGGMFEWTRLEAEGLGMIPKSGVLIEDSWGAYFAKYGEPLRFGDNDAESKFGGGIHKDVVGVIGSMQADLLRIGYSVNTTGSFDKYTREAVDRFKRHFFTGERRAFAPQSLRVDERVDAHTASVIHAVALGMPDAVRARALPEP